MLARYGCPDAPKVNSASGTSHTVAVESDSMTLPISTEGDEPPTGQDIAYFDSPPGKVALLAAVFGGFDDRTGRFKRPLPPKPFRQQLFIYILYGKVWGQRARKPRRPTLANVAKQASRRGSRSP
jgi:hypothetical protein